MSIYFAPSRVSVRQLAQILFGPNYSNQPRSVLAPEFRHDQVRLRGQVIELYCHIEQWLKSNVRTLVREDWRLSDIQPLVPCGLYRHLRLLKKERNLWAHQSEIPPQYPEISIGRINKNTIGLFNEIQQLSE